VTLLSGPGEMAWTEWTALLDDMGFNPGGTWSLDELKLRVAAHSSLEIRNLHGAEESGIMSSVTVEIVHASRSSVCSLTLQPVGDGLYNLQAIIMGSV